MVYKRFFCKKKPLYLRKKYLLFTPCIYFVQLVLGHSRGRRRNGAWEAAASVVTTVFGLGREREKGGRLLRRTGFSAKSDFLGEGGRRIRGRRHYLECLDSWRRE